MGRAGEDTARERLRTRSIGRGDEKEVGEEETAQPIMLYLAGIPLYAIIRPTSDALAVGMEQCRGILEQRDDMVMDSAMAAWAHWAHTQPEQALASCSQEFARALRPHITELQRDVALKRERNTFENEAQAAYLKGIDLAAEFSAGQRACRRMLAEANSTPSAEGWLLGRDWVFNPEQAELCGVEHDVLFSKFGERQWMPLRGYLVDFLGTRTAYDIDCEHDSGQAPHEYLYTCVHLSSFLLMCLPVCPSILLPPPQRPPPPAHVRGGSQHDFCKARRAIDVVVGVHARADRKSGPVIAHGRLTRPRLRRSAAFAPSRLRGVQCRCAARVVAAADAATAAEPGRRIL